MQQQQAARQNSAGHQRPVTLQHLGQHLSGESAVTMMSDNSPRPRSFVTKSLDQQHIDWLNQLDQSLLENPFDYYSHLSLVTTLHQGFQNHLATFDSTPHSYELVQTLQEAYKTMCEKYPLGETLWHYRLNDEKMLARNVEERMGVLDLYQQATQDEPYSAKLWAAYGEYISYLVSCSWEQDPMEEWPEEERLIGRELFKPKLLLEALREGAERVKYNLQESNLVWDRYLQVLEEDLEQGGFSQEKATQVAATYTERLSQPHATWQNTFSRYSSFNTRYYKDHYEELMEEALQKNTHIKQQYANREEYEFKVLQAFQAGDQDAEYHAVTRYLKWEKKTMGVYSFHLVNALYERATLRFPVDPTIWEDHVEFLIWQKDRSVDLLHVLQRATRHCPWSGALWSYRILTLEAENRAFAEIEHVKHTATGSGLLEHAGLDELIKVQTAWCGYLRRRAFDDPRATEDDVDIAEVGIRSALEFVREVGIKKHGRDWVDPKYRLERIHMKFWLQRGHVDEARKIWDAVAQHQADSYDFWYRFYIFEMVYWSQHATRNEANAGHQLLTPSRATAVLERGMERLTTIDQPEPLLEMYMNHCEQHETVLKVRSATIERRRAERVVSIRRDKEQASAAAIASQQETPSSEMADSSIKRKRDDLSQDDDTSAKKSKTGTTLEGISANGQARPTSEAPSEAQSTGQKRDRENTSIIVRKLPLDTTQTKIRQFFTDAGTVRNLVLKEEPTTMTAIVEFETSDEADYALSKEAKGFEGHSISIERGQSTTVYVANYPERADEAFVRNLFILFGDIVSIRFPSLKFDTHRRFCYVQFSSADSAVAATRLDGTVVEGFKLIAKISNPAAKKKRDGATAEGREVYVWHLNFKIKQKEIAETFSQFGKIDRIKCPTTKTGNNKGFCYVVYENKENADAAVAEMHGKDFWGLDLHVEIAADRGDTKPKIKSTLENTDNTDARESTPGQNEAGPNNAKVSGAIWERSIAILNLPDTVPDVRIKPLVEPFDFKKITLEPQHGGAIIEFTAIEGAGKAEIALQGKDFEGRKLQVGTVQDLRKQKGEWKAGSTFIQPHRIQRPAVRGRSAGGRGRGKSGISVGRPMIPKNTTVTNGEAKSNADFRAMIMNKEPAKDADKMEE